MSFGEFASEINRKKASNSSGVAAPTATPRSGSDISVGCKS